MSRNGTALITGASSGIGAAYADRLARRGYDLVLVARSADKLAALAARLMAEFGVTAEVLVADLSEREDIRRVEARLRADPAMSLLVNNAGMASSQRVLEADIDRLEQLIELNVVAVNRLAIAAAQTFVAKGGGGIINIASIAVLHPQRTNAPYSAMKAFVMNLTEELEKAVVPKGVKLQVVLPGATRTEFFNRIGVSIDSRFPPGMVMDPHDLVDAALAGFDAGELVTIPSLPDIADWNAFLAARLALEPGLSLSTPAARYATPATDRQA